MSKERQAVTEWLETVKFRRKLLGGVDEQDVWKKLGELDELYAAALEAERVRYDTLLDNYKKTVSQEVRRMIADYNKRRAGDV